VLTQLFTSSLVVQMLLPLPELLFFFSWRQETAAHTTPFTELLSTKKKEHAKVNGLDSVLSHQR
jgi:hypothetical protein